MIYSRLYKRENKKVLYALACFAVTMVGLWLFLFIRDLGLKNGWEHIKGINRIQIVNVAPTGFEVVWSTEQIPQEAQWVEWKSKNGNAQGKVAAERIGDSYRSTIYGLEATKTYTFKVRTGSKTYILDNLAVSEVKLPKEAKELPISPAYGKVLLPSGKPYANGLVLYEVEGFYPVATLTKGTGEWLLPLTGLVKKQSVTIEPIGDTLPVTIRLFSYPKGSIRTTVGQTRPLRQSVIAGTTQTVASLNPPNTAVLGATAEGAVVNSNEILPSIIYPKERALIPGNKPLMRGVAIPGKDVLALIQGPTKQYSYRTTADSKGEWIIQYPLALESGAYTFSISTVDKKGFPLTLRRSFSIIKSGEQVLGDATGSPTLAPTVPVPTYANPTTSPTIRPTIATYPTVVPTRFVPTATPPVTGGGMTTFAYVALFCIVVGAGLVLAF